MEDIARILLRHLVFIGMAFFALYIFVVSFGASVNFFNWGIDARVLFATFAHISALLMHGYWMENR